LSLTVPFLTTFQEARVLAEGGAGDGVNPVQEEIVTLTPFLFFFFEFEFELILYTKRLSALSVSVKAVQKKKKSPSKSFSVRRKPTADPEAHSPHRSAQPK
jgi:hypothetical protein